MTVETQDREQKSLKFLTRKNPDWQELAKDCVCFANAGGGEILIGFEDGQTLPPDNQTIPSDKLEQIRKRIGELTINVTIAPQNVLHVTVRRNENLARIFHDLKLMEREGSGFDKIYEVLLSQGRRLPVLKEGSDRVEVTIYRQILKEDIINLLAIADRQYQLSQREKIALGLLAQQESLSTRDLAQQLSLPEGQAVTSWLGRLLDFDLIKQSGQTKGTRYYVDPEIFRTIAIKHRTTLQLIEPHRLEALILEDLRRYPKSSISNIQERIGPELSRSRIKRTLTRLVSQALIVGQGENRWRCYSLNPQPIDRSIDRDR